MEMEGRDSRTVSITVPEIAYVRPNRSRDCTRQRKRQDRCKEPNVHSQLQMTLGGDE